MSNTKCPYETATDIAKCILSTQRLGSPDDWIIKEWHRTYAIATRKEDELALAFTIDGIRLMVEYQPLRDKEGSQIKVEGHTTKVGVSLVRELLDIAIDISKRLLPHVEAAHAKVIAIKQTRDQYFDRCETLIKEMAQLLEATPPKFGARSTSKYANGSGTNIIAEVYSAESVNLKLSYLSLPLARKIINLVMEQNAQLTKPE